MAHVLFNGDIRQHPALRSLFWKWGVTVGRLEQVTPGEGPATVEDCDAVVHLGGGNPLPESVSGAMPDGAEAGGVPAAAAAPLLVIGAEPAEASPWVVIPDPGPQGSRLKVALQSCQERARLLRGDPRSRRDVDQFRNFLGHELRSPLTAIKTALTVMATEKDDETGSARMLGIARRNLIRLAETVEWSQELMVLAEAPPAAELGRVNLGSVAEAIPDQLEVHLAAEDEFREVITDPGLLGTLAGQMERVMVYACPGSRPIFRLALGAGGGECLLSATVPRTREMKAGHDPGSWNRDEFEHLVRMLISPHLLQVLGVRPRLPADSRDLVELTIGLPLCAGRLSPDPARQFTV